MAGPGSKHYDSIGDINPRSLVESEDIISTEEVEAVDLQEEQNDVEPKIDV